MSKEMGALANEVKSLKSLYKKEKKEFAKNAGKGRKNGLANKVFFTPEMCEFMNVSEDTQMTRNEAKAIIRKYIKEKKLQDPGDRRIIHPDKKLKSILSDEYTDEVEMTYFTMEKYIKHNFVNKNSTKKK